MTRVVVVGGGVIGLAVAWRAARKGHDVTVVDPHPGQGASWVAAGMLAPVTEAHLGEEAVLNLNRQAAGAWPAFARSLAEQAGVEVELRTTGTVVAALDTDDRTRLDDLAERLTILGLAVDRLTSRQLRRREPALAPGVRGGLDVTGDHAVDNRQVVRALLAAAPGAGVALDRRAAVGVATSGEQVVAVELADGDRLACEVAVVAAGHASPSLSLPEPVAVPVRPVRGEVLRLADDPTAPLLGRTVRGTARGWPVYLVPRSHGELVIGATADDRRDAGPATAGGILELLRAAVDLVPGVRELGLVEASAGLRPGTPDNLPLVGPTAVAGLVLATGHFRHGILQAPLAAEAVAAILADGVLPDALAAADPRRFA